MSDIESQILLSIDEIINLERDVTNQKCRTDEIEHLLKTSNGSKQYFLITNSPQSIYGMYSNFSIVIKREFFVTLDRHSRE